ncbi:MAG: hypothetical protein ABGY96_08240 [bacterium]|nr:hypothetical protein [Gammaproteobacteria bacterium]HIL97457.1 hypothetical protein [Pseudomonadales bacterium]
MNRARKRSPSLVTGDRFLFGLLAMLIGERRLQKVAGIIDQFTRRIIGFAVHAGDCDWPYEQEDVEKRR